MQTKNFPIVTISIIVLNGIIFAVGILSGEQIQIIRNYGFIPDHFFYAEQNLPSEGQSLSLDSLTRLFTSMFIHANFIHIAFNLFALAYQNPLSRVVPAQFIQNNDDLDYDREKYKEMLLDASETVLGIFGFDRTLFGKPKDKKWWMQLRRNRETDMKAEINS